MKSVQERWSEGNDELTKRKDDEEIVGNLKETLDNQEKVLVEQIAKIKYF